jgi:ubiquitin-conjugating enzyme E2 variant
MESIIVVTLQFAGCAALSIVIADFMSGLMHWAEDTWLVPGKSALLDRFIVTDNIDHHRSPGKIRAGHYWGTNRVCIALAVGAAALLILARVYAWEPYLVLALLSQSNQIHLWAHSSRAPRIVQWLQRIGLLQSVAQHAQHHKRPYGSRYCIITSYLNPVLDRINFWRGLDSIFVACGATVQRASAARGGY